ncbi:MAG: methyltransferase domain-containing protein [Pedobacter sp.]|nr:MAG: methyltransferase domain-containing protein [Pedobacter sp.]
MDQYYWETRWQKQETGWDIGYASPAIIDFFKNLEDKSIEILIPGCGHAYEAVALYQMGFKHITLVDISKTAIEKIKEKLADQPEINILHQDFFDLEGAYDVIIEQTFFCALNPSMRQEYADKMYSLLKDGGQLTGLLFNREFEAGPPFGGNQAEYEKLFKIKFDILKMEPSSLSIPQRAGNELYIQLSKKNRR